MALPITDYADLIALIQPEVPGAEEPTIRYAIRRAGRRFCEDTEAYILDRTYAISDYTITNYELLIDATELELRRLKRVRIIDEAADYKNRTKGQDLTADEFDLYREETGESDLILRDADVLTEASEGKYLHVKMVVLPRVNADVLPNAFLSRYETGIRLLALHELLRMQKVPWANPALAQQYMLDYDDQVIRARFENTHENKHVDLMMQGGDFLL